MGQAISRRVVPRLNTALKKYEKAATKDALDDMSKRQALARSGQTGGYSDPNAVHGGFRRENAPDLPQEAAQEQFLRREHGDTPEEMPEDLLKFLNDNPLEKTVDRELTSPKVYDSLTEGEADKRQKDNQKQKRTARTRTRRTMPLAESMIEDLPDDVPSDIAGATGVQRTTNFSTAEEDEEDDLDRALRMTDKDLAALLRRYGCTEGKDNDVATSTTTSLESKQKDAQAYLADVIPPDIAGDDDRLVQHTTLVANAMLFNGMPTLLKDVDSDFVGVWSGRVRDMERMKLRAVDEKETTIMFEKRVARGGNDGVDAAATAVKGTKAAPAEPIGDVTTDATSSNVTGTGTRITMEANTGEIKTADNETPSSPPPSSDGVEWKNKVMEEKKNVKSRLGSSGPATRKFLEEEGARAAAAAEAESEVSSKK